MSNNKNNKRISYVKPKRSKLFIVYAFLTLFVIGVAGAWIYSSFQKSYNDSQSAKQKQEIDNLTNDVDVLISNNKANEALSLYESKIKTTGDREQLDILLTGKATVYFNDGKYNEALNTLKELDINRPSENSSQFIAQIYDKKGDVQKSIEYYNKAISLVNKNDPMGDSSINEYKDKIKMFGGEK
jgi:tetratricopeptide (TPR) repeat protein